MHGTHARFFTCVLNEISQSASNISRVRETAPTYDARIWLPALPAASWCTGSGHSHPKTVPNSRDITQMTQKLLLDHRQNRGISPKDARKQPVMTASSTPSCCSRYAQHNSCIICGCSLPNSRDITQMTQKLLPDHRQKRGLSPKDARKQPAMTASSAPPCCS